MHIPDTNKKECSYSEFKQWVKIKNKWQIGDWEALTNIDVSDLSSHGREDELRGMIANAYLHLGMMKEAKEIFLSVKDTKILFSAILSALHCTLARASLIHNNTSDAKKHFEDAVALIVDDDEKELVVKQQIRAEYKRLGIPPWLLEMRGENDISLENIVADTLLELNYNYPNQPALLIALAEHSQKNEKYDDAIRFWQELASVLQEATPQIYYDRLDEAYQQQKSFPLGTPEEEHLNGNGDKHEFLKKLHQKIKPSFYLEIGVQTGKSLQLAECEAIGIDPMPRPNIKLKKNHTLLRMTSDVFFAQHAGEYLKKAPDLVFIDGMHLFEYALRDFVNVEKYAGPNTIVVIDDIFPGHPAQAQRKRSTRAWTGDVWKLAAALESKRPDLKIKKIDIFPTGLIIIKGFSRPSRDNAILFADDFGLDDLRKYIDRVDSVPENDFLYEVFDENEQLSSKRK